MPTLLTSLEKTHCRHESEKKLVSPYRSYRPSTDRGDQVRWKRQLHPQRTGENKAEDESQQDRHWMAIISAIGN